MKRHLLNLLTLLSLLLCAAVVLLWLTGVPVRPGVTRYHARGKGAASIYFHPDGLYFWRDDSHYGVNDGGEWHAGAVFYDRDVSGALGFGVGRDDPVFYTNGRYLQVPYWFVAAVTAALPGLWVIDRRRRQRRLEEGGCPSCGYDLTGNVSGVCPECGSTPPGARTRRDGQPTTADPPARSGRNRGVLQPDQ